MNTDDAPSLTVLAGVRACAASWMPEARIIGNVRAGDIVRAVDDIFEHVMSSITEEQMAGALGDIEARIMHKDEGEG